MSVYRVGSNKSSVNNFPAVRPTLDLDFANIKTLDPRITFTRASGGSYVGADGLIKYAGVNEARFDHDPETGESLGLLVEEARTNLLLRSEEFQTTWLNFASSETVNTATAPDGSVTADKLIVNNGTATDSGWIFQDVSKAAAATTYTFTVYCKAAEFKVTRLVVNDTTTFVNRVLVEVNLSNGAFITPPASNGTFTAASGTVTALPNGWYRISLTGTSSVETSLRLRIYARDTTASTGDGASGIYIWGAQLEAGSFPTSYIPTQASTRTRALDNARITGKNFSDFFNFNEGTSYVSFKFGANVTDQRPFLNITSSTNLFLLTQRGNVVGSNHALQVSFPKISSSFQIAISNTGSFISPFLKANSLVSYKSGDISYSTGGRIQFTSNDTFAPLNDPSRPAEILNIGNSVTRFLNGTISRITYYPKRLPNSQLIALTR